MKISFRISKATKLSKGDTMFQKYGLSGGEKTCSLKSIVSYAAIMINMKNKEEGKRQKQCSTKRRGH
jgi:hypothetical protein